MHRTVRHVSFVLAVATALGPVGGLEAQDAADGPPPAFEALAPGSVVRVTSTERDVEEGRYLGFRTGELMVRDGGDSVAIPVRTLRSLHMRSSATWEAAWKVGVIGAATGAAWSVIVGATDCPTPTTCTSEYWPRIPIHSAVGLGVGAVVGAGVGRLLTRWERLFP